MQIFRCCLILSFSFAVSHCFTTELPGQTASPVRPDAVAPRTEVIIYRQQPQRKLTVYYPDGWQKSDRRPVLVILRCNIPAQREHFRQLGMVIVKPQLANVSHGRLPGLSLEEIAKLPRPRHQVEDTKSAIRFIRANASRLGIDSEKITATGTSGGGDLALQAAINQAFEHSQDDRSISPRPNALVLYCPAFDGIDIWFVRMELLLKRTRTEAPGFLPFLNQFVRTGDEEYAVPVNHRADLIRLAAKIGSEHDIPDTEISSFQAILELFNKSDWQLLHPVEDARRMSASRILTDKPLPPTLIMFGDRDHLYPYQTAFVESAREHGQRFDLRIFEGGGHSFMMQPLFLEPSTREVETFLRKLDYLPDRPAPGTDSP